jgi:hypothetical protein
MDAKLGSVLALAIFFLTAALFDVTVLLLCCDLVMG